jgi:hypothetical protein
MSKPRTFRASALERAQIGEIIRSALRLSEVGIRMGSSGDLRGFGENSALPVTNSAVKAIRHSIDNSERLRLNTDAVESQSSQASAANNDRGGLRDVRGWLSDFAGHLKDRYIFNELLPPTNAALMRRLSISQNRAALDPVERANLSSEHYVPTQQVTSRQQATRSAKFPQLSQRLVDSIKARSAQFDWWTRSKPAVQSAVEPEDAERMTSRRTRTLLNKLAVTLNNSLKTWPNFLKSDLLDVSILSHQRSSATISKRLSRMRESSLGARHDVRHATSQSFPIVRRRGEAYQVDSDPYRGASDRTQRVRSISSKAAQLRAQPPAFASAGSSGLAAATTVAARSGAAAMGRRPPFVVNFSPTIVIDNAIEPGELERRVTQTIERHSHELVRIVTRELQSQRRAMF